MKRIFDIIFSFIGMLILIPVFVITTVLIKIYMHEGSVFFTQKRIGKEGKPFVFR